MRPAADPIAKNMIGLNESVAAPGPDAVWSDPLGMFAVDYQVRGLWPMYEQRNLARTWRDAAWL